MLLASCGGSERVPTFHEDVAPLLGAYCQGCHRQGGMAPFALETVEDARGRARTIAKMVRERRMPPWPATDEPGCPPQVGRRTLSPEEIRTIERWAEHGAREGPPRPPASPPAFGELDHVDAVLQASAPYRPLPDSDDYRCFRVSPGIAADRFITAFAIRPGVPTSVHHVQLWGIEDDAGEDALTAAEAVDPEPGYACREGGVAARYLTVWAASDPVRRHPAGTGLRIRGGHSLIMEIHYHDDGAGRPDHTAVELELADSVERPATVVPLSPPAFSLPPGQARARVGMTMPEMDHDLLVWGVRAHMHGLGRSAFVSRSAPTGPACLLNIPRWDTSWQLMYFYEAPVSVRAGEQLSVECEYDTTSRQTPTVYGIRTVDEMCFAYFYVTDP